MTCPALSTPCAERSISRHAPRDPQPHFKPETTHQPETDAALRPHCTDGEVPSLTANLEFCRLRAAMQARMGAPRGLDRSPRRIATTEPVYSNIECAMAYCGASARCEGTVAAEGALSVLSNEFSAAL